MTRHEVAELLERIATEVEQLPGVSRINPHVFADAKSELAGGLRAEAREYRTEPPIRPTPAAFQPGARVIGGRKVVVERRRA